VDDECLKRARMLQENVMDNLYVHSDLAIYNLNAHAIRGHKKKLFKAHDARDITSRLSTMYPAIPPRDLPKSGEVLQLPIYMQNLMRELSVGAWKVEWMFNGRYEVQMNDLYRHRYYRFVKDCKVYSKLADTMGFSQFDMGYKMWLESLHWVEKVVRYEGNAMLLNSQDLTFQVARMVSHVYDFDHLVTLTIIVLV
jgi:hypothetical protein